MIRPDIMPLTSDEPAVVSEGLASLVDMACRQTGQSIKVTPGALHREWRQRREARHRRFAGIGIVAAAAVAALFVGLRPSPPEQDPTPTLVASPEARVVDLDAAPTSVQPAAPRVELADDIRVTARTEASAAVEVLGPRELRLESGSYEIRVLETATAPALVQLPGRTLELTYGVVLVVLAAPQVDVTLQSGEAAWLQSDGSRTQVLATEDVPRKPRKGLGATSLARSADALQHAGDHAGAISALEKLVSRYPRSSSARAALLDLARLYRKAGRTDAERCAYRLYLDRWPHAQVRGEVERALERLGAGPACDGIEPH